MWEKGICGPLFDGHADAVAISCAVTGRVRFLVAGGGSSRRMKKSGATRLVSMVGKSADESMVGVVEQVCGV